MFDYKGSSVILQVHGYVVFLGLYFGTLLYLTGVFDTKMSKSTEEMDLIILVILISICQEVVRMNRTWKL